jgi:hypothetical protein
VVPVSCGAGEGKERMSEFTTPPSDDDITAAFELVVGLLKERRHLLFDEVADMLRRHGYPVSGEHPYLYKQNECLIAWLGMSHLFWTVADRLRRHPNVQIEHALRLKPEQYPVNLRLPIARDDTGAFTEPHWFPCEFVWCA